MKKEIALHAAIIAFKSSSNLTDLVPFLKEHCEEVEYRKYLEAIGDAIGCIHNKISKEIYEGHPEIKAEIDKRIEDYGFVILN